MPKIIIRCFFALITLFAPFNLAAQSTNSYIGALRLGYVAGSGEIRFNERAYLGQNVLLMFWASDCPPCLVEMRGFLAIKRQAAMPIIIVTQDWGRRERMLLEKPRANGAIIVESRQSFENLLGYFGDTENSIPYSVLINPDGTACIAHLGVLTAPKMREMQSECR